MSQKGKKYHCSLSSNLQYFVFLPFYFKLCLIEIIEWKIEFLISYLNKNLLLLALLIITRVIKLTP